MLDCYTDSIYLYRGSDCPPGRFRLSGLRPHPSRPLLPSPPASRETRAATRWSPPSPPVCSTAQTLIDLFCEVRAGDSSAWRHELTGLFAFAFPLQPDSLDRSLAPAFGGCGASLGKSLDAVSAEFGLRATNQQVPNAAARAALGDGMATSDIGALTRESVETA